MIQIDSQINHFWLDSTKRANNEETPAAPIFDDTMEDLDEGELEGNDNNSKRPLHETEMELDDAATTKRRRNLWITE